MKISLQFIFHTWEYLYVYTYVCIYRFMTSSLLCAARTVSIFPVCVSVAADDWLFSVPARAADFPLTLAICGRRSIRAYCAHECRDAGEITGARVSPLLRSAYQFSLNSRERRTARVTSAPRTAIRHEHGRRHFKRCLGAKFNREVIDFGSRPSHEFISIVKVFVFTAVRRALWMSHRSHSFRGPFLAGALFFFRGAPLK